MFKGKRVLITGAGRGIGRGLAKHYYKEKAEVIAISKNLENLKSLKNECPEIETVVLDLSDWDLTKKIVSSLPPIDILINNAGYGKLTPILTISEKDFDEHFSVNVKGIINVSQEVARKMIENNIKGSIINVSSQASTMAIKDHLVYGSSKGAVDQITRNLTLELGGYGIRVNSVNPTVIMTDMAKASWSDENKKQMMLKRIPLGRFGEIEEVVDLISFLSSDKASMISGAIIPLDGGSTAC